MESAGVGADAGGAESDGHLRRVRDIHFGRRISNSGRRNLPNDDGGARSDNASNRRFQEIRHLAQLTPVVLTEGRISLRVMTEVSEVSQDNALQGGVGGTTIPSIKTRRAEPHWKFPRVLDWRWRA